MDGANVGIAYDGPGNQFHVLRNVFKDTARAVVRDGYFGDGGTYEIDYNGRCGTHEDEWTNPIDLDADAQHNLTETGNPFVANANGSYYLTTQTIFRNAGDITAAGLSGKTTTAATTATGRIKTEHEIASSEFWSLIQRNGDTPNEVMIDLGYHYEPVDIIIARYGGVYVTGSGTVHGVPGLTVAFSHEVQLPQWQGFAASDGGSLDMRGTGPEPIRFASTLACGDKIGSRSCEAVPGLTPLFGGVAVSGNPAGSGTFEYCTIENAFNGLSLWGPTDTVSGCRFDGCMYGVVQTTDTIQGMTVKNCLFRDCWVAAAQVSSDHDFTLLNCTVFRGWRGVEFSAGADATVRNCILTSCTGHAIWKDPAATVQESYNSFWLNANNANFSPLNGNDRTDDPKFVNTTVADLYERFYLNQGPSTTSPCVIYGNPDDTRFLTTALDKRLDLKPLDIGYHYPVRGHLRVTPSYFFEFEDGEPFYPVGAVNESGCVIDSSPSMPAFYTSTLPARRQYDARNSLRGQHASPAERAVPDQRNSGTLPRAGGRGVRQVL